MVPGVRFKFAKRLRKLRKKAGWTQEELSGRADIAYKHIQRLEGSRPSPVKIDTIDKLAKAFGMTCSKLLDFRKI